MGGVWTDCGKGREEGLGKESLDVKEVESNKKKKNISEGKKIKAKIELN